MAKFQNKIPLALFSAYISTLHQPSEAVGKQLHHMKSTFPSCSASPLPCSLVSLFCRPTPVSSMIGAFGFQEHLLYCEETLRCSLHAALWNNLLLCFAFSCPQLFWRSWWTAGVWREAWSGADRTKRCTSRTSTLKHRTRGWTPSSSKTGIWVRQVFFPLSIKTCEMMQVHVSSPVLVELTEIFLLQSLMPWSDLVSPTPPATLRSASSPPSCCSLERPVWVRLWWTRWRPRSRKLSTLPRGSTSR